jgi:hypothetical protein
MQRKLKSLFRDTADTGDRDKTRDRRAKYLVGVKPVRPLRNTRRKGTEG